MAEKLFIQNRKGLKMCILVEEPENPKGLAFVMHGLSGTKDQPHIKAFRETLKNNRLTVVSFDTTNTYGESEGKYEDTTLTNYYSDLEDVISWASGQIWYQEPFWLTGHSLGGFCVAFYAENYPDKVKAIAPISTVVSGKMNVGRESHKFVYDEWKRTGWNIIESQSRPGLVKKLPWAFIEDGLQYDLLPKASRLAMPVLLVVGDQDDSAPVEHQRILFDVLSGKREMHIIKGADHKFIQSMHIEEVVGILDKWIKNNL